MRCSWRLASNRYTLLLDCLAEGELTPAELTARMGEPRDLRVLLHDVRDRGVSISDQDVTVGIAAVGAPIFGFDGQVRAALSTSGIREAILGEESPALQLTIEGAAEISRQLGYTPPARREALS